MKILITIALFIFFPPLVPFYLAWIVLSAMFGGDDVQPRRRNAGVYGVRCKGSGNLMYIGRSNNIPRRLNEHRRRGSNAGRFMRNYAHSVEKLSHNEGDERRLIRRYRPPLNIQYNN